MDGSESHFSIFFNGWVLTKDVRLRGGGHWPRDRPRAPTSQAAKLFRTLHVSYFEDLPAQNTKNQIEHEEWTYHDERHKVEGVEGAA